jgi:hypothetical protein
LQIRIRAEPTIKPGKSERISVMANSAPTCAVHQRKHTAYFNPSHHWEANKESNVPPCVVVAVISRAEVV